MNLRSLAAGSALALTLTLTACGSQSDPKTSSVIETTITTQTTTGTEISSEETTEAPTETEATTEAETEVLTETQAPTEAPTEVQPVQYQEMTAYDTVNTESYVRYPMQVGGKDADTINALIKLRVDEMLAYIHDEDHDVPDVEWTCNIYVGNYVITRDDEKYLSILWTGDWFHSLAAHPNNFAQSIIIDKETLTEVKLSDLYTIDEAFVSRVQEQVNAQLHDVLAAKYDISPDEIREVRASEVTADALLQSGTGFGYGLPVCLTDDGILVSVCVPHYIGDHCEIEIPQTALS